MSAASSEMIGRDSADSSVTAHPGSHVNTNRVEISERTLTVILALIAGIAIAIAVDARIAAVTSERESRMLQYYLLELDAKVIAAGIKRPQDSIANKLKQEK